MANSFGFLVLNESQENKYFTEVANHAHHYDLTCCIFTPDAIEPKTEYVSGLKYYPEEKTWKKEKFQIPTFIYDRCFYSNKEKIKKYSPIVNWLKNRPETTFLGHGLPNKWDIYQSLQKHSILSHYIPETHLIKTPEQVLSYLRKKKQIIIKPVHGSGGKGILSLCVQEKGIEIRTERNRNQILKIFTKKAQFTSWLYKLIHTHPYMMQPFLKLKDNKNFPFDIRVLLQKDSNGNWFEQGRGVRVGKQNSIISNIRGGGDTLTFSEWVNRLPSTTRVLVEDEINTILQSLIKSIDTMHGPLFELGIDIGVAQNGSIWLLDINSKPGHQVILRTQQNKEEALYLAPLHYCNYLIKNSLTRR